jgi:hypothetical protein
MTTTTAQTIERIRSLEERMNRLEQRLDEMFRVLLEHGERITRIEERG